ncbi:uncharacterized protein L201_002830 [Kwoniella dendrophila CBS 6074]|uniref:Rho-GAP domain-containing protein n=1 Tax=Kwoniella dendrophila CBS 6074 TaxID=1295534 RepID=A0AAX4JTP2_9TREE
MSTISPSPLPPALSGPIPTNAETKDKEIPTDITNNNVRPSLSRPLSEISENEQHRRSLNKLNNTTSGASASNRSSIHSNYKKDRQTPSRPVSEVIEEKTPSTTMAPTSTSNNSKRMSMGGANGGVQTITLNLVDYAKSQSQIQSQPQPSPSSAPTIQIPPHDSSQTDKVPPPPSPTTKPTPPELPKRPESLLAKKGKEKEKDKDKEKRKSSPKLLDKDLPETGESSRSGVSSFLLAKRASLRPSSLIISYAEVAKPVASPPAVTTPTTQTAFDSVDSLQASTSGTNVSKPATKSKPSWLRRASGTAALRSKSRTPPPKEESTLPTSTSLPPALPPRKGLDPTPEVPTSQSLPEEGMAPPPFPPRKTSYANITAAGSSRSRLGDGEGRPAYSPSGLPPSLPSRDNIGNIRGKIAAWTAAAAQSSGGFARSESSTSLQTQSGAGSNFTSNSQRIPSSAQRVLGHAGSAVQKGWAGLRSRGVGGSISSMSSLGQSSRSKHQNGNGNGYGDSDFAPSTSWGSNLTSSRSSRDRTRSDNYEPGYGVPPPADGPVFETETIIRRGDGVVGKVFGRDVVDAGKEWCIANLDEHLADYEIRRRKCLPAVVIRCVEYLQIWGPKEEGIFRISGRSSHIARLRREFDSGADIDLPKCHPGDLDPHAVAGLFKSYLRELPSPLLTHDLQPQFDSYVRGKGKAVNSRGPLTADNGHMGEKTDLQSLLHQLPQAHWFLLADIVKLLDLIPRHAATNRMTQNALMLSLGPSLNIPGGILNELIEQRETLFAEPPSPSTIETAAALIDFGDVNIPPVTPLSEGHASQLTDENGTSALNMGSTKSKKAPRLPAKPSLTKLFTSSSYTSLPRQKSVDTLHSIINTDPPRVEVPISPASPLPSFETDKPDLNSENSTPKPTIAPLSLFSNEAANVPMPETPPVSSGLEQMEEVHYPAGTVAERSNIFSSSSTSTPIADKFQSTSSPFPPLRDLAKLRGSNGSNLTINSSTSDGNLNRSSNQTDNVNAIRRGTPVFFSSSGVIGHTRSASASATNLFSGTGCTRRKDGEEIDNNSNYNAINNRQKRESSEDIDDGRKEKRLSAGPDNNLRVREYTV